MGQAIIFNGVVVNNPLQTVTFVEKLVTAEDYVAAYKKKVTTISGTQETALVNFVNAMIAAGVWDSVVRCYPMLGGLSHYTIDLKNTSNQSDWSFPTSGLTWDSTRNAPFLSLPGNANGTNLVIDGLDSTGTGCAFFFSCKLHKQLVACALINSGFVPDKKNIVTASLVNSNGGYQEPNWNTPKQDEKVQGIDTKNKNSNSNYLLNIGNSKNKLWAWTADYTPVACREGDTDTSQSTSRAVFGLGGELFAEAVAPAQNTLNGCANMFMAFSKRLSDDEISKIAKAVYDFNQSCGRYVDFE